MQYLFNRSRQRCPIVAIIVTDKRRREKWEQKCPPSTDRRINAASVLRAEGGRKMGSLEEEGVSGQEWVLSPSVRSRERVTCYSMSPMREPRLSLPTPSLRWAPILLQTFLHFSPGRSRAAHATSPPSRECHYCRDPRLVRRE